MNEIRRLESLVSFCPLRLPESIGNTCGPGSGLVATKLQSLETSAPRTATRDPEPVSCALHVPIPCKKVQLRNEGTQYSTRDKRNKRFGRSLRMRLHFLRLGSAACAGETRGPPATLTHSSRPQLFSCLLLRPHKHARTVLHARGDSHPGALSLAALSLSSAMH